MEAYYTDFFTKNLIKDLVVLLLGRLNLSPTTNIFTPKQTERFRCILNTT